MDTTELWNYLWEKKVAYNKPFDRYCLWVLKDDFDIVKGNFINEFNPLHRGNSFRSESYFLHIHAVYQGKYVFIHKDIGNVARFFPLIIIHFLVDILPFFIFTRIKGISMKQLWTCPLIK